MRAPTLQCAYQGGLSCTVIHFLKTNVPKGDLVPGLFLENTIATRCVENEYPVLIQFFGANEKDVSELPWQKFDQDLDRLGYPSTIMSLSYAPGLASHWTHMVFHYTLVVRPVRCVYRPR
jgi:hypothetical protein